eukprot:4136064-Amphidinium_carterae.1
MGKNCGRLCELEQRRREATLKLQRDTREREHSMYSSAVAHGTLPLVHKENEAAHHQHDHIMNTSGWRCLFRGAR